ncbi:acyloxyacyl hydrolase [Bowmanella sp. Y26]|uniref:Lipid A deacylase n=2 Tax=Bowmanella yangjiangensis TaxID=2811230 RepID=A0ABS3CNB7_9ALTE|nr:acyloxyacyl hydrolase [Bowmanella yangjiangensis]MBT1062486.1 acyloxyacyl hydrolase [Bowmanella yangjiangensis]
MYFAVKYIFNLLIGAAFLFTPRLMADQGIAIDLLRGEGDLTGVRLAYRPYYGQLTSIDWLGEVDIYFELSLNIWEFSADSFDENNLVLALSPVISKQFTTLYGYPLKWEFGIGFSLVDDTRFANKDIGSHYQFEDRLGLVLQLEDKESLSLRYMHYSNGGLNDKNPGMDFINLSYAWRF